ncbi:hypothetical protein ABIB35_002224 [Arthrobacter sp. UYP6]|uniref:hypothetical protein n=1 Tax=Arthrobacter sp. UYP6 TaxID=1756378 RepID=UPI003392083A
MMNESPDQDDAVIRRLLKESEIDETPELLEGLRQLRSFTGSPAVVPTGELAALLADTVRPRSRSPRHRGLILSFTLAAAMGAGASGVAASSDLRVTSESHVSHPDPFTSMSAPEGSEPAAEQDDLSATAGTSTPADPATAPPGSDGATAAAQAGADTAAAAAEGLAPESTATPAAGSPVPALPAGTAGPEAGARQDFADVPVPVPAAAGAVPPADAAPKQPAPRSSKAKDDPGCRDDAEAPGNTGRHRAVDSENSAGRGSGERAPGRDGESGRGPAVHVHGTGSGYFRGP